MDHSQTAQASFTVAAWDETISVDIDESGSERHGVYYPDRGITKAAVSYAYAGDIDGTSEVTYVMGYKPGDAPVLGLERFVGSIGGHEGSCVWRHIGVHDDAGVRVTVEVVDGMGTGGLVGLRGEASVDIGAPGDDGFPFVLHYDLD